MFHSLKEFPMYRYKRRRARSTYSSGVIAFFESKIGMAFDALYILIYSYKYLYKSNINAKYLPSVKNALRYFTRFQEHAFWDLTIEYNCRE